jgi:hypothetical protein
MRLPDIGMAMNVPRQPLLAQPPVLRYHPAAPSE